MSFEFTNSQRQRRQVLPGAAALILAVSILIGVVAIDSPPKAARSKPIAEATSSMLDSADPSVERGQYLVQIGGCNDCHTPEYGQTAGKVPVEEWLIGWSVGFQGPWGTSYASNLRLTLDGLSEEQWLSFARTPRRPPMPWFNLRDMTDQDLRAIYRFIRYLGPKGERVPKAAGPGEQVSTPYISFEPRVDHLTTAIQAPADEPLH